MEPFQWRNGSKFTGARNLGFALDDRGSDRREERTIRVQHDDHVTDNS